MLNHSSVEIGPNNKYAYKMSNFAVRYNTSQRQLNTARRGFAFRVIRRFAFAAIRFAKKCEGRGWISWTVAIVNAAVAIAPRDPLIRIAAVEFALSCSEDRWAEALLFDDFDESIFAKRIHFYRLAKICLYLERVSDAIKYLRIAEPALSSSWAVCHLLGSAYLANSDLEGAVNWFQKSQCLAITKRRRIDSLWSEACAYRQFGDPKSIDIDSQIIALDPESNVCRFGIVGVSPELNATSTIADEMRSTLLSANLNLRNRAAGHFALGTLHERSGDLTTAFLHFTLGNQVRSLMQSNLFLRWSRDQCKTKWDFFSAEKIQELSRFGDRQMQLICIVGMPRSGTTMLESIFNMHPQIEGIGERNDLQRQLVNFFPLQLNTTTRYPYCCNKITPDTIRKVSEFVSMRYRRIAKTGKPWLATKTPEDFWDLGLFYALFPNIRILHCVRDPLDTCLSCYQQNFEAVPYSTNLYHLKETYERYLQSMEHWKAVLPSSALTEVRYESITNSPGDELARLCKFIGVPMHEECLNFHSEKRRVQTASHQQVRQKIHTKSIGRAAAYREYLGPLMDLGSVVG